MEAKRSLPNYKEYRKILDDAVDEVKQRLASVRKRYSVTYEAIIGYLEVHEPQLLTSLKMVEKECDTDILKKLEAGTAIIDECNDWRRCVQDWRMIFVQGINKFEDFQVMSDVA